MKVGIQCTSYGQRCGISTYSIRLNKYLNQEKDVESFIFVENPKEDIDVLSIQYEPGIIPPHVLNEYIRAYVMPIIVVTAHHTRYLSQFYPILDGVIFHDESQIGNEKPWEGGYRIIPHPALVYPKKNKKSLREKYGLPDDKLIIGTAGFITGTGKNLPGILQHLIKRIDDDMYLYFITSFWKAGDLGRYTQMKNIVKKYKKEDQVRIDPEFVSDEVLNEKMQACDLLFSWNMTGPNDIGSQSGIASDMYGSYTKLIVKDSPHYNFIKQQDKVLVGRPNPKDFAEDVLKAARDADLNDVPDPTWLSWENQVKYYVDFFKELLE